MPAIFHRDAFRAALGADLPTDFNDSVFEEWDTLARALDRLSPEQRCDAIYADWLIQLASPSHTHVLPIRNLLIGQGAIAANYLAELAQNADDAADGSDAEVRIIPAGEWLLVANNGRKVTAMNLIGLSRFFVHAAGKIRELNQETIGRFGIGFKSSYRFASEVFVHTWDASERFTFRLPICSKSDPNSHPQRERLENLRIRLTKAGVPDLHHEFADIDSLGYCTPEFCEELPSHLVEETEALRASKRGTLFCFHIRPTRAEEVRSRVSGQSHEVYELCPLFLPNLRRVGVAQNELTMRTLKHDLADDLPECLKATRVELTTHASGKKIACSRFWKLQGTAPEDRWQLALHADSNYRLRVEQEADEHGTTVKDGAAYAFFPLNKVTWPLRLHLHLALPTNLARDNWNENDSEQVRAQIRRAIQGLAGWLMHNPQKWHSDWKVEKLLAQELRQSDEWASELWENLKSACRTIPIIRTLTGSLASLEEAKSIPLLPRAEVRGSWAMILQAQATGSGKVHLSEEEKVGMLAPTPLTSTSIVELCRNAALSEPEKDELQRAVLVAVLGWHQVTPRCFVDVSESISCRTLSGSRTSLNELLEEPSGAELTQEWHAVFARLEGWGKEASWQNSSIPGTTLTLRQHLAKLAKPVFNPPWRELPSRLGDEPSWRENGELFWSTPRTPCPPNCLESALAALRVPAGDGRWLPISGLWLDDDSSVACFAGLLTEWPLPYTHSERKRITGLLKSWGIFEAWTQASKKGFAKRLADELAKKLTEHAHEDAIDKVFDARFEDALPQDDGWRHLVSEAEKAAISQFLANHAKDYSLSRKSVLSASIEPSLRAALCLHDSYAEAPPWLTDPAHKKICQLGLQEKLSAPYLGPNDIKQHREHLSRELLERFYKWSATSLTETQRKGLSLLFAATSPKQRRDWLVGLSAQRRLRMRDLFLVNSQTQALSLADTVSQRLLAKAEWRAEPLPPELATIPLLCEACIQTSRIKQDTLKLATLTPLEPEQIPAEILPSNELAELVGSGSLSLYGSPQALTIRWLHEGELVATLENADFAITPDKLIVHRFRAPADESQCLRILSEYETHAVPSAEYVADQSLPPYERYQKHRETIVSVLLKENVRKVGYDKHHILRELLQNAESAYASKTLKPEEKSEETWFEFIISPAPTPGWRRVCARHIGRAFNEPDNHSQERHDVERIWRLAAATERTPDEVGRFNRGFKTVFAVAANGTVRIRSGEYDFEVIDLLMLKPAEPKPNPAKRSQSTEFFFESTERDALEMFRLSALSELAAPLPILNSASLVFLAHLQKVTVQFDKRRWQWFIHRGAESGKWRTVSVVEFGSNEQETFLVYENRLQSVGPHIPSRRYAAAVRLGPTGLPRVLEKHWKKFRLTFETDHEFPLEFLVNGDFEADQGRVGINDIAKSGLVELAYDAVLAHAQQQILAKPTKETWLAWARVVRLKWAATGFNQAGELKNLHGKGSEAVVFFCRNIPHSGELVPASSLEHPTPLLRRLSRMFAAAWGLNVARWIDQEISEALPECEHRELSFHGWLSSIPAESPVLKRIQQGLESLEFKNQKLHGKEAEELKEARCLLLEKLRPSTPPPLPNVALPTIEPWTVANLWHWWNRKGKPAADYVLEGKENWTLLYPDSLDDPTLRRARLKQHLNAPDTQPGKEIWYRLFSLAAFMSAGRRMSELRAFWHRELIDRSFWEKTSGATFAEGTQAMFEALMRRRFLDLNASGEDAHFWRRVFYDVRKIHKLVWEDGFPATLLHLIQTRGGPALLNFLKTGTLVGQQNWTGVFGQSAGAPLFFVVRELVRLGVISDPQTAPYAFFVCTPVRRAMVRIGWIDADLADGPDFETLAKISMHLHQKLVSDREFGPKLITDFDIPLLHLGFSGSE